ncbi:thiamine-phosphate kinase [Sulfurimonas sp.]|nr:thiamine-phosphate kinase [Sulfurimonas sp.]
MNLENYFISQFKSNHIGDDGALIDGFVYSKDAFFENVHFKRKWMSFYEIAYKSMMVNISDAIAMNAVPKYILLSVAMPKNITKDEMRELSSGFKDAAAKFGADIIGGDTISNSKLDITVTVISKVDKPLLRDGMRKNHLLAYTGELGKSAKDLKKLLNLGSIHKKSKFVNIQLRDRFISNSSRYLSSGMDISDGLFSDLDKLSSSNNLGFKFSTCISKKVGCSGEEYEMLVSFDKRNRKAVLRRAKLSRTKLTIFASSARKKYTNRCKAHHF